MYISDNVIFAFFLILIGLGVWKLVDVLIWFFSHLAWV